MSTYSQGDQQDWLYHYFFKYFGSEIHTIPRGLAVDGGANDGLFLSNTLALEESGWRVLCIEPNPSCAGLLKERRKESYLYGISDYNGIGTFNALYSSHGPTLPRSTLTMLKDEMPMYKFDVEVRTLDYILEEASEAEEITHVEFINLDIEGGEAHALRGLDLDKWKPQIILIEDNHPPLPALPECREILAGRYKEIHRVLDDVFFERIPT